MRSLMIGLAALTVVGLASVGCGAQELESGEAPEATSDLLDLRDEGTSYNGWSQNPFYSHSYSSNSHTWGIAFSRSYGDSTRGGGTCLTVPAEFVGYNNRCKFDDECNLVAQDIYGSTAYGYCYASLCYFRPGSQASWCLTNSNRNPGEYYGDPGVAAAFLNETGHYPYPLGCMTKAAGPSTACGGTNTSLYMRTVNGPTLTE
jgi:hypothetical protein